MANAYGKAEALRLPVAQGSLALDGLSDDGLRAMLFQHSYSTFRRGVVSLCSRWFCIAPVFWRMDYGQPARTLVQTAVE